MKIVHIAPSAPYNDYWGYQDNLLPKYQRKLGHEVTMITTNTMHSNGKIVPTDEGSYILNDGVKVIRCNTNKYFSRIYTNISARMNIFEILKREAPDFIFHHGLVSQTIFEAIKYKKRINPNCIIVQDNHQDYNIGRKNKTIKDRIICTYHRLVNRLSIKYVDKVYGVTPWRKEYAEEYFRIPKNKTDVLIMGADDDKIDLKNRERIRKLTREKYGITENDFLIVTGGKIDKKKKIDVLIDACADMDSVKLLIFGSFADDLKEQCESKISATNNIVYAGWIESDKVYDYFFAADLVFFPGQHSVLWEQACASKVPCVFEKWDGMEHVNNGGNSTFITPVNVENIQSLIKKLLNTSEYKNMKKEAESEKTDIYLYSNIARKSLECVMKC